MLLEKKKPALTFIFYFIFALFFPSNLYKSDYAPCMMDTQCLSGICHPTNQYCESGHPLNAPCLQDDECQSNFCHPIRMICSEKCNLSDPSCSCSGDFECESEYCHRTTFVCTNKTQVGGTCLYSYECITDWCNIDSKTCEEKLATGELCHSNEECYSGACDPYMTHPICYDKRANGQSCTADYYCASLYCHPTSQTCQKRLFELGEICHRDIECESGACNDHVDNYSPQRCYTKKKEGTTCHANWECHSGRCNMYTGKCQLKVKKNCIVWSLKLVDLAT